MKKYIPYIIIAILIILLIWLFNQWRQTIAISKSKDTVIEEKNSEITYRKTKEDKAIADKVAAESTAKGFAEAYPKLAKQISDEMDIKIKNLKVAIQNGFTAQGSGNSIITNNHYIDSSGRRKDFKDLDVSDGYLSFHATIYDSINAPYTYTYTDTMTMAIHVKKKWVFGKRQLYGSGMLNNKNAKVTNSTNVLIAGFKDKRFSIGPYAGYSIRGQFDFGISVQYALIKF